MEAGFEKKYVEDLSEEQELGMNKKCILSSLLTICVKYKAGLSDIVDIINSVDSIATGLYSMHVLAADNDGVADQEANDIFAALEKQTRSNFEKMIAFLKETKQKCNEEAKAKIN